MILKLKHKCTNCGGSGRCVTGWSSKVVGMSKHGIVKTQGESHEGTCSECGGTGHIFGFVSCEDFEKIDEEEV